MSEDNRDLLCHEFDPEEQLKKHSTRDYLIVASRAPSDGRRAAMFKYKPIVLSKKGNVVVSIDNGPKSATVSSDGTVSWFVPESFRDNTAKIILRVRDDSKQEVFHVIDLNFKPK